MVKVTLINPNLVVLKKDMLTTGIVFLPISLAYFASVLRKNEVAFNLIDSFGDAPNQYKETDNFYFRGLKADEIESRIPESSELIVVYALNILNYESIIEIIKKIRSTRPDVTIAVLENTQSVLGFSLFSVRDVLFNAGADVLLTGESEVNALEFTKRFLAGSKSNTNIPGVLYKDQSPDDFLPPDNYLKGDDLDSLPFPAWDLFPLKNYWKLGYGHGVFQKPYLVLLTSRGCSFKCKFCVQTKLNKSTWRPRSAENVLDEIEYFYNEMGITEFHIEDLHPGLNENRIRDIATGIIQRGIKIKWQISAGTKIELLKQKDTLELMRKSGFWWIGFCPESGSVKIQKKIGKIFDENKALQMISEMKRLGIGTQACFILGFPEETAEDRMESMNLMSRMTKEGLDEIAIFIVTPIPGSPLFDQYNGYKSYSELNFTPTWRSDFEELSNFRMKMYKKFMLTKYLRRPYLLPVQALHFIRKKFYLRMEMTPFRALETFKMKLLSKQH